VVIIRLVELSNAPILTSAQCAKPLKLAEKQRIAFREFRLVNLIERHPMEQKTCIIEPVGRFVPKGFDRRRRRHAILLSSFNNHLHHKHKRYDVDSFEVDQSRHLFVSRGNGGLNSMGTCGIVPMVRTSPGRTEGSMPAIGGALDISETAGVVMTKL
jgi:hypothetical protein